MMKFFTFLLTFIFLLSVQSVYSQSNTSILATVSGKVISADKKEALAGVLILIEDTEIFTLSAEDGSFILEGVPERNVVLSLDLEGYETKRFLIDINRQVIEQQKIIMLPKEKDDKKIKRLASQRVSQGRTRRGGDTALLARKKNSLDVQDSIGSDQISKTGDSDAGNATKRVTGATLVGNNIFIRGMGERYVSIRMAGSSIASPDPDKRIIPLDIFPTSIIESIIVQKNYSANQPGEFGSGAINIELKDYPEEVFLKINLSLPYQNETTFQKYAHYHGGSLDWLGYDDGTRSLPQDLVHTELTLENFGNPSTPEGRASAIETKEKIVEQFSSVFSHHSNNIAVDLNLGVSFGNSFKLKSGGKLGYLASLSYKRGVDFENKVGKKLDTLLAEISSFDATDSIEKHSLGAFATFSFSPQPLHQFKFTSFYFHKNEDLTSIQKGQNIDFNGDNFYQRYIFEFKQNDIFLTQLNGRHIFKKLNSSLFKYSASYSLAYHYKPDKRQYEVNNDTTDFSFRLKRFEDVKREWLENTEHNINLQPEFQLLYPIWSKQIAKTYFGAGFIHKARKSYNRIFTYNQGTAGAAETDIKNTFTSIDDYLQDEFLTGFADSNHQVSLSDTKNNSYQATLTTINAYIRQDLPIVKWLKMSAGFNYEFSQMIIYDLDVFTSNTQDAISLLRDDVLTPHNLIPSFNATFTPTKQINIRSSYSYTVARPDFREAVKLSYNLNEGNQQVFGNENLRQTDIHSIDFRFEWYPGEKDLFAISAFFKHLNNPIEFVELASDADDQKFQYINGILAQNYGIEIEAKKNFGFIHPVLERLSILGNFTLIQSDINIQNTPRAIYSQSSRPLQDQSPWIINALISYDYDIPAKKSDKILYGISISTSFNMVGPRIISVALKPSENSEAIPDRYLHPIPLWDISLKQRFLIGEFILSFRNILDRPIEVRQGDILISSIKKGSNVNLKYSFKF